MSNVIDATAKIELLDRDVVVRAIKNFHTGAQRISAGNRRTATLGPGLRTIEGLGKVVLQLQRSFLASRAAPDLGCFSDQTLARAFRTRLAIVTCFLPAVLVCNSRDREVSTSTV